MADGKTFGALPNRGLRTKTAVSGEIELRSGCRCEGRRALTLEAVANSQAIAHALMDGGQGTAGVGAVFSTEREQGKARGRLHGKCAFVMDHAVVANGVAAV